MVNKIDGFERETAADKKRRKTTSTDLSEGSASLVTVGKDDVYMNTIAFEKQEANNRSSVNDMHIFNAVSAELKDLFSEVAGLKMEKTEETTSQIREKRVNGSLALVLLKKLNRLDKVRIRDGRTALHQEKLRVDSNRLQLQNLLYEEEHLKREIQQCYLFKSQDEEIDLVPEYEFYQNAPEAVSRPTKTQYDDHAKRIARLEWELQQRKELDSHLKELQTLKETIENDIVAKSTRLHSLGPRLRELIVATRPLQEALQMPFEKGWEIQKTVRLLAPPLYLLYTNMIAYSETCDNLLSTMIHGDEEEAKQMESLLQFEFSSHHRIDSCNNRDRADSDNDENDQDPERGVKKRHRGQPKTNLAEQRRENLLTVHPLCVTVTVRAKAGIFSVSEKLPGLAITFYYLPNIDIVTINCSLTDLTIAGTATGDILSMDTILSELFSNDTGLESPNPKTNYQLNEIIEDADLFITLLKERGLGKPYRWAQELCGLEFISAPNNRSLTQSSGTLLKTDYSKKTIPSILRKIRTRWEARIQLYKQIYELESKLIDTSINNEHDHPIRISSTLLQWISISFEDYLASGVSLKFLEDGIAFARDLFFRAIVVRGSAKLESYICIPCCYPETSPIWSFSLNWNGKHTAVRDSSVREMEYWCNSTSTIDNMPLMLPTQLKRAMSCLDIYLETEGPYYTPGEFKHDKSFLKPFRGRPRARPFRIAPNGSNSLFTQI
ncbi:THO complex subunit 5 homolog isoform X1 [Anopheles aquasalis]|nr:THO complex subunit 5 homolog isoform X1 [Anopheles aquasalis]